jgi:hypothetical protein
VSQTPSGRVSSQALCKRAMFVRLGPFRQTDVTVGTGATRPTTVIDEPYPKQTVEIKIKTL